MTDEIVELAQFGSMFEAEVAAAHLDAEGIAARVVSDNAGGVIPSMSMLEGGVRLLVSARDAARAKEILARTDDADAADDAGDGQA